MRQQQHRFAANQAPTRLGSMLAMLPYERCRPLLDGQVPQLTTTKSSATGSVRCSYSEETLRERNIAGVHQGLSLRQIHR
jgi:hypothetical protein